MIPQIHEIHQASPDEHIFIVIYCKDRPAISLDLTSPHGRRVLSTRVDGMSMGSQLVDVKQLPPLGADDIRRYCSKCGEKINSFSSAGHSCKNEIRL